MRPIALLPKYCASSGSCLTQLLSLGFLTENWALQCFSSFVREDMPLSSIRCFLRTHCVSMLQSAEDSPVTQATSSTSLSLIWWETGMGGRLVHMWSGWVRIPRTGTQHQGPHHGYCCQESEGLSRASDQNQLQNETSAHPMTEDYGSG